jgi:hypothetical protein
MAPVRVALALCGLLLTACPGPPPCSARTCEGCCRFASSSDPGTCHPGDAGTGCGAGGVTCATCAGDETCSALRVCRGPDEPWPAGAKIVFATSLTFTGDLGGLDGGDARCEALATDAGLPGAFLAFLSDVPPQGPTVTAASRFTGNGPWLLRTRDARGRLLRPFDDLAQLAGPPRTPIDQDERGRVFGPFDKRHAWTGTLLDGGAEAPAPMRDTTCRSWSTIAATGLYGIIDVPTDLWSGLGAVSCASDNRLYCFEQ